MPPIHDEPRPLGLFERSAAAETLARAFQTETVTHENVSLYEHYGFQVAEQCRLPGLPLTLRGFYRRAG